MIISSLDRLGRRGTPLFTLQTLLKPRGVSLVEYDESNPGDAFVTCSNTVPKRNKDLRVVAYFASERKSHGMKLPRSPWERIDHGVYTSNFYKTLVSYPVRNSSVLNWMGGISADSDPLSPVLAPRKIKGTINFVCCAKWWKRKFKRLRQTVKLFNKFILKQYPQAQLHVLGCKIESKEGKVYYYAKSHGNTKYVDIWRNSHVHISLSPYDAGPKTLSESLHYRVPFISPGNSAASDFVDHLGKCGEIVKIDPLITSLRQFKKLKPFTNKKHFDKEINYELVLAAIRKIIDNFEEYTSWKWTDEFNYEVQTDKWMKVFGFHG